jgi:O-6-methylguanine DNA methyltransferase
MIEIYFKSLEGTWFVVALHKHRIVASSFGENKETTMKSVLGNLPFNVPFQVFLEPSAFAAKAFAALKLIHEGRDAGALNLPLATSHLPAYTEKVLSATLAIPVGYVTSYGSIAKAVGGGPRAVGNIMAGNPFAPIVPCHRVVKSDFTLGGYGGGLSVKLALLRRERRGFSALRDIQVEGGVLRVFPVEYVLRNFV